MSVKVGDVLTICRKYVYGCWTHDPIPATVVVLRTYFEGSRSFVKVISDNDNICKPRKNWKSLGVSDLTGFYITREFESTVNISVTGHVKTEVFKTCKTKAKSFCSKIVSENQPTFDKAYLKTYPATTTRISYFISKNDFQVVTPSFLEMVVQESGRQPETSSVVTFAPVNLNTLSRAAYFKILQERYRKDLENVI